MLRFGGSGNDYLQYDVPTGAPPIAPACEPGQSYPDKPGTAFCPSFSDAKNCKELAAQPGFCAAAAKGPQPNCCKQCNFDWNATITGKQAGCTPFDGNSTFLTLTCNCLTEPRLLGLLEFATNTGSSLVFGLSFAADVNETKTMQLLKYIAESEQHEVYGFEYGNERDGRPPQMPMPADSGRRQAQQFTQLQRHILPKLYPASGAKAMPKLVGPDSHGITDPLTRAFVAESNTLGLDMHAVSYHEYGSASTLQGPAPGLVSAYSHPSRSDLASTGAKPDVELWVGEAGGCAGGGSPGVTDSYSSGRWWLASLGIHALNGVTVFCRQDLVGGNYGLLIDDYPWNLPLNTSASAERAVQTTPDYWTALLWKRLMGRKVLRASVSGTGSNVANLLVFVHCSQRSGSKGGVSAVIINADKGNTTLDLNHSPELRGAREDYQLSPVADDAHGIALNGVALRVFRSAGSWAISELAGRKVVAGTPLVVPGLGYSFVEFPSASVDACKA